MTTLEGMDAKKVLIGEYGMRKNSSYFDVLRQYIRRNNIPIDIYSMANPRKYLGDELSRGRISNWLSIERGFDEFSPWLNDLIDDLAGNAKDSLNWMAKEMKRPYLPPEPPSDSALRASLLWDDAEVGRVERAKRRGIIIKPVPSPY